MKTINLFLIAISTAFSINLMGQSNNDGVFNSPDDYKHPNAKTRQASNFIAADYVKPAANSGNYKQQNSNANPKIEGIVIMSGKKEKNWNALNNPSNYKTQR